MNHLFINPVKTFNSHIIDLIQKYNNLMGE